MSITPAGGISNIRHAFPKPISQPEKVELS
jgi:hypothetical protein